MKIKYLKIRVFKSKNFIEHFQMDEAIFYNIILFQSE
jgi:hypothetical protein